MRSFALGLGIVQGFQTKRQGLGNPIIVRRSIDDLDLNIFKTSLKELASSWLLFV